MCDLFRNDQKRLVGVKEGEQERGWTPRDGHAPMEKDVNVIVVLRPLS